MSKGGGVDIPSDYTFKLGSDGSTIHIDSDLDNIHLKEIAPVTVNSNVAVTQPIVTQSTSKSDSNADLHLKVDPLTVNSNSKSELDVKPLVVDSCQTLKIAPLPPIRVHQPYSQHFGITFMGMELWGLNISGSSETFVHSPPKIKHHSVPGQQSSGASCEESKPKSSPAVPRSGLRVRVK